MLFVWCAGKLSLVVLCPPGVYRHGEVTMSRTQAQGVWAARNATHGGVGHGSLSCHLLMDACVSPLDCRTCLKERALLMENFIHNLASILDDGEFDPVSWSVRPSGKLLIDPVTVAISDRSGAFFPITLLSGLFRSLL